MIASRPALYGRITDRMIRLVHQSRPWVRYLSILFAVVGILEGCAGVALALQPMPIRLAGVVFLVFAGLALAFSTPLHRMANAIEEVERGDRGEAFARALESQGTFFKMAGIATLISLVLMIPVVVGQVMTVLEEQKKAASAAAPAETAEEGPPSGRTFTVDDVPRLCAGRSTFVCLLNRGGELVEGGARRMIRDDRSRFEYGSSTDGSTWVRVASPAMSFRFVAPNGATLVPGLYPVPAEITEEGRPFGGCTSPEGSFLVLDAQRDFLGNVERFVADFEITCNRARHVGRVSVVRGPG